MDQNLEHLLAKEQIRQVLLDYCRGIDRMDRELVRRCYHPDARDEHGSFSGSVDEFLTWCWRLLGRYHMTMHYLANCHIEVDGDRALADSYGVAIHEGDTTVPEHNLTTGFRYVDTFERRAGQWKILQRVATTEWVRRRSPEQDWPIPEGLRRGSRDRDDPIYQDWRPARGDAPD